MLRAQYRAMLAAGVRTLEFELWVDAEALPLRVCADAPGRRRLLDDRRLPALGQPVRIVAPTAKQVFDADALKG